MNSIAKNFKSSFRRYEIKYLQEFFPNVPTLPVVSNHCLKKVVQVLRARKLRNNTTDTQVHQLALLVFDYWIIHHKLVIQSYSFKQHHHYAKCVS